MENNFNTAMFQANLLYGIDLVPEDFEELGLIAWNLIGNKRTRLYKFIGCIDCDTLTLQLPCNVDIIEAVTTTGEDWNYTTNIHEDGDLNSSFTEEYIEGLKDETNPLYLNGRYINFERNGDTLLFDKNYGCVQILYKGIILDEDGLPTLNDKEVLAIATYVAYVTKFKEGLISNNANILNLANVLKAEWSVKCDSARIPEYFNQNDLNDILDAKTSWNRKIYNKSFKPLK